MALGLTSYYYTLIIETQKAILALLHIHQETLCSRANQDKTGSRQDKVWCPPLLFLLWLWMLSPLMFGHNVSSVHHCHTRPAQLLRGYISVKLSHHRAVIWRHTAPRPVVRDPGVGQALPHYHAVACWRKRHKEMGGQQTRMQLRQCTKGFTQWGKLWSYKSCSNLHPAIRNSNSSWDPNPNWTSVIINNTCREKLSPWTLEQCDG